MPVTERALVQRVNRALRKRDQGPQESPRRQRRRRAGPYYIVDLNRNALVAWKIARRGRS